MIDLPDSATFAAALADRRIHAAAAVAALAGLVRGFSGFGGAMIYMPLVAAIYDPRIAAVTILAVDFLCSTPFAIPETRRCNWREVWPISIAMAVGVPFGTWLLLALDPIVLRWGIAIIVLSLLPPLAIGWRYQGEPRLPVTIGVGLFAGVSAGAVQIAGPPVILYWLSRVGSAGSAVIVRANIMVFFVICGVVLVTMYAWEGLFTAQTLALALLLGVPYILGVGSGARAPPIGSTAASPMPSSRSRRCSAYPCSTRSCADAARNLHRSSLEQDDFSSNRHSAPALCLSMIFSENRFPLFGIML